ncbi:hypothetical protein G6F50_016541 [Rhizopus delemar]|uniref:DNA polymerase III alpha subunit finger domain-containing protein n=1 Tax=Rhizopus delemar TaxID=936053 RepID=A0A9P7C125_9FUNG|nr:hypothetical protein G6F50_016541 [Rhizopus delemar]
MQLAVDAASYTPGEADALRRSMAAWKRRGGLEPHREKLLAGMLKNGFSREYGEHLFEQIKGFGDYGFPESHAASFALADSDLLLPSMPQHLMPGIDRLGLALRSFPVPLPTPPVRVVQAWPPRLDSDPAHRWVRQTIKQVCDVAM